jgi:pimeloyl-ACP methyl ester carboxylesterase
VLARRIACFRLENLLKFACRLRQCHANRNTIMINSAVWILAIAVLCPADPAPLPASLEAWLSTTDHNEAWAAATGSCRKLLASLDLDQPQAQRNRKKLEATVQLLRQTESFDWRSRVAIGFLQAMLEDLAAEKSPHARYAGAGVAVPYWSPTLGRVEAVWVHVPPRYEPGKSYQMLMYYKCGGGIHLKDGKPHGGYRPTAEMANATDTFHVWSSLSTQVKGRKGAVHELREVSAALALQFGVDRDRVFLTGWSDGGFTSLWLASRYPQLVAGIVPVCANWQYTNVCDVSLANVPLLAVDGWYDGGYNKNQFNRWQVLHGLGADASAIWGHHGHTYQPYEDAEELKMILDWAKTKRRNRWPKQVRYTTWNLSWPQAYWVTIERMANPALAAQIDVDIQANNRIEVQTANVAAYRLELCDKLLDMDRPVTIITDGKSSYTGPVRSEIDIELVKLPDSKFTKSPTMPGGILAQIDRSFYGREGDGGGLHMPGRKWIAVRPTCGDEKTLEALAGWWPDWAVADSELTDDELAGANLFLFGGPGINGLTARLAGDLPVKFGSGKFRVGNALYDQPANAVKFLHPNPLAPERYVIVYAFNDAATFARNGFYGTRSELRGEFRKGDCVVMGLPKTAVPWAVSRRKGRFEERHLVFDSNWLPADQKPIGTISSRMDMGQLLRLRADAIREATGADVGCICELTPLWSTWVSSLPAGPVTLDELSSLDMLPEYVVTGDVTGEALLRIIDGSPAHTVLNDPRDPAYDSKTSLLRGDIDPRRTYRIATGYRGRPAYRVEPKKMPPLWRFSTPEQFTATGNTSLPMQNVRQLPLQLTEAVARYVEKRGSVAPRAVCFDVDGYLLNPRDNEFGSCDWLHVGIDGDWRQVGVAGDEAAPFRYKLNVGLRKSGDPELAPPRGGSKAFVDLSIDAAKLPAPFRFAKLEKRLPVDATIEVRSFSITGGKGGTKFALADAGAASTVGGAALVRLRLTNRGNDEVAAFAALTTGTLTQISANAIRIPVKKTDRADLLGIVTDLRNADQAAVLIRPTEAEDVQRVILPGAGFNFGLYGLKANFAIPPGKTIDVPLLLVAVDTSRDGVSKLNAADRSPLVDLHPTLREP